MKNIGYENNLIDYFISGFQPIFFKKVNKDILDFVTFLRLKENDNWIIGNLTIHFDNITFPDYYALAVFDGGWILKSKIDNQYYYKYFDNENIILFCENDDDFMNIILLLAKEYALKILNKMDKESKVYILSQCRILAPNFEFSLII
ncbi:MAG: hypothetical protein ACPGSD_16480 [Flavobacteriales bacterium]